MAFVDQRLDIGLFLGASYGPRFSTAITVQSDGVEQRRVMWNQPLILFNFGGQQIDRSALDYLLNFHASVKGALHYFKIRDYSDYKSGLTAIGTGNGTQQSWQLVKRYSIGSSTVTRAITKPVDNANFKVYLNGVETGSGWSCDFATGILYTQLSGAIAVEFEFDVPVRFNEDQINFRFDAADPFDNTRQIYTLQDVTLTEVREPMVINISLDPAPSGLALFDIGYDYRTQGGPKFDTGIQSTASEFELRTSYRDNPLASWSIGDRQLSRAEVDYWLSFFRVHRGMAYPFYYYDWQTDTNKTVRFAEDRIALQLNAFQVSDEQVIFSVGGLAISEIIV